MELKEILHAAFDLSVSGDYVRDGLVHCAKCGEPIQRRIISEQYGEVILPTMCSCRRKEAERQEEARKQAELSRRINDLRAAGLYDPAYARMIFDVDDAPKSAPSRIARKYLANWSEMRRNGLGMILYGDVGTGKTFYAACVANGLIERLVPAFVTTVPRLIAQIHGGRSAREIISVINGYPMLVIDDLGAERDTEYAMEQLFAIIDGRSMSGKPTIITTNLSMQDLLNPVDLTHKRIFDRVLEMCPIRVPMLGQSRRMERSREREKTAIEIFRRGK